MTDQLHPVQTLEGVGPARAAQLRAAGVDWAEDLFLLDEIGLKPKLARAGFPLGEFRRLRLAARFLQVPGVDHQGAEALASAFNSVEGFAGADEAEATAALEAAAAAGLIPAAPSADEVDSWQREAFRVALLPRLAGRIVDENGDPVAGATVTAFKRWATTASDGRFILNRLGSRAARLSVTADGFVPKEIPVTAGGKRVRITITAGAAPAPAIVDEHSGGLIRKVPADCGIDFHEVGVTDWPAGTVAQYRRTYQSGAHRVQAVWTRLIGSTIEVQWAKAPSDTVPAGLEPGDVLEWDGSNFTTRSTTITALREQRRFAHFDGYEMGTI